MTHLPTPRDLPLDARSRIRARIEIEADEGRHRRAPALAVVGVTAALAAVAVWVMPDRASEPVPAGSSTERIEEGCADAASQGQGDLELVNRVDEPGPVYLLKAGSDAHVLCWEGPSGFATGRADVRLRPNSVGTVYLAFDHAGLKGESGHNLLAVGGTLKDERVHRVEVVIDGARFPANVESGTFLTEWIGPRGEFGKFSVDLGVFAYDEHDALVAAVNR